VQAPPGSMGTREVDAGRPIPEAAGTAAGRRTALEGDF
jgi:hypothetical protein